MKHIKRFNESKRDEVRDEISSSFKASGHLFTIGKPIVTSNPTNVYKLVIENMSGSGDAYHNTETLFEKKYEPLIKDIIVLCEWAQGHSRSKIEDKWEEVKSNHSKFFEEEIDEDYEPIITRDVTNPNSVMDRVICRPKVVSLTWFDQNGIEYKVN